MDNPLRTPEDYELYLYTLLERFPSIDRSTVTLVRRGATLGRVAGEIWFAEGFRAVIRERLVWRRLPVKLDWYGYEIWRRDEKLCWYDPQPHPSDPQLQENEPHHKHIPPDIKHNRAPTLDMSFDRPNLPVLVAEIESRIEAARRKQRD